MSKRNFFRPAHRDKAEPFIIQALRSAGASVFQVSGKDLPDLLVGFRGVTTLLEVKTHGLENTDKRNGKTYTRTTATSKGQKAFLEGWRGGMAVVVHEPDEALRAIGAPYETSPHSEGRWLAENGAFLCDKCWLPENGLHAKECPTRKKLARPPKVQSAYRAAKVAEDLLPKRSDAEAMAESSRASDAQRYEWAKRQVRGVDAVTDAMLRDMVHEASLYGESVALVTPKGELQPLPKKLRPKPAGA